MSNREKIKCGMRKGDCVWVRVWGGGGGGTILNVVMKEYIIEKMTF